MGRGDAADRTGISRTGTTAMALPSGADMPEVPGLQVGRRAADARLAGARSVAGDPINIRGERG